MRDGQSILKKLPGGPALFRQMTKAFRNANRSVGLLKARLSCKIPYKSTSQSGGKRRFLRKYLYSLRLLQTAQRKGKSQKRFQKKKKMIDFALEGR